MAYASLLLTSIANHNHSAQRDHGYADHGYNFQAYLKHLRSPLVGFEPTKYFYFMNGES